MVDYGGETLNRPKKLQVSAPGIINWDDVHENNLIGTTNTLRGALIYFSNFSLLVLR